MKPALVLLAAGEARRFGRLKQFEPVGPDGEALLDYAIWDALRTGFGPIVIVVRPEIEDVARGHLVERWAGVPLTFVHQTIEAAQPDVEMGAARESGNEGLSYRQSRKTPWGTAHAVLCSAPVLHGPFAVANADDFYGERAWRRACEFFATDDDCNGAGTASAGGDAQHKCDDLALIAYRLAATLSLSGGVSRAVCEVGSDGYVERIVELHDVQSQEGRIVAREDDGTPRVVPADVPTSMNLWLLRPGIVEPLQERFTRFLSEQTDDPRAEFRLSTELDHLVRDGRVRITALPTTAQWLGVTYSEDLRAARVRIGQLVTAGAYPPGLGAQALERMR